MGKKGKVQYWERKDIVRDREKILSETRKREKVQDQQRQKKGKKYKIGREKGLIEKWKSYKIGRENAHKMCILISVKEAKLGVFKHFSANKLRKICCIKNNLNFILKLYKLSFQFYQFIYCTIFYLIFIKFKSHRDLFSLGAKIND